MKGSIYKLDHIPENWHVVQGKHEGWDAYFIYMECHIEGKTYCSRSARKGFDFLNGNHGSLNEIKNAIRDHFNTGMDTKQ